MTAQGGAATGESAALATVNAQLAEMLLLQAALSEGAAVPGMTAGLTAGASIVAAAAAGGAAAALPLQEGGIVTRTGTALVHAGETILPAGGMGGDVSITNHVTVAPGGIDLTDFTNAMNEQMRLALRGHTRNLPV